MVAFGTGNEKTNQSHFEKGVIDTFCHEYVMLGGLKSSNSSMLSIMRPSRREGACGTSSKLVLRFLISLAIPRILSPDYFENYVTRIIKR